MGYYVIYDKEGASTNPIYGIYNDRDAAEAAIDRLAEKFTDDCFKEDPVESGLCAGDRPWVLRQCRDSLAIQEIKIMNDIEALND